MREGKFKAFSRFRLQCKVYKACSSVNQVTKEYGRSRL